MKLKKELCLRSVCGDDILVPVGSAVDEFHGLFFLSPVAAAVFKAIQNGAEEPEILRLVLDEFDIDEPTAKADIDEFLNELRKLDII